MAKAYSDDLRRKLLEAYQEGEGSLEQLATRFRVSTGWAQKIWASLKRTGKMEKPPGGPRGPRSKLTPEVREQLRAWITRQPDLTLAELQQKLLDRHQIYSSLSRLWEVLGAMGLRLKKSLSTPPSRIQSKAKSGAAAGGKRSSGSIRRS